MTRRITDLPLKVRVMELHERAPRLKQEEIAQLVGAKQANVSVVLKKIHDAGLCECEVISFDSMLKTGNE